MFEINDIYRVQYMQNRFGYVGTLRNEKRFNIGDDVFISLGYDGEIFRAKVIGVELPLAENPEFIYKVKLPAGVITQQGEFLLSTYENITCERIFSTPEEAKQSAIKNLEHKYELQMEEIERYFKQFNK